jgi:hypothetical protein
MSEFEGRETSMKSLKRSSNNFNKLEGKFKSLCWASLTKQARREFVKLSLDIDTSLAYEEVLFIKASRTEREERMRHFCFK